MRVPCPLDPYGRTETSQLDEDGIIACLLAHVPVVPYFVEFGAEAAQCNCLRLHRLGWAGLFMDAARGDDGLIKKEWVTPANINALLAKYQVPDDFGVLSIDIDGQDYWVWSAMTHRPPVVVIEYNGKVALDRALVMPRNDSFVISGQGYGASLLAMTNLAWHKGYVLVHSNGNNAFYVRLDCFDNADDFVYAQVARMWPTHHIDDPIALGFVDEAHHPQSPAPSYS